MSTNDQSGDGGGGRTSAFDIRIVIGALLAIFGVIILFIGLFGTSDADLERAGGTNLNIWTGAGLLVAAAVFVLWARIRPIVPDEIDEAVATDDDTRDV